MRGQTQTAAAQGLEFRNISISVAATRQGSKWQKVITKGTGRSPTAEAQESCRKHRGWRMEIQASSVLEQQQACV